MTLHVAIEKLLRHVGQPLTTAQIADRLNKNAWYKKGDGSPLEASQINVRTKKYTNIFNRNGTSVSLSGQLTDELPRVSSKATKTIKQASPNSNKDEEYVLDICDKVLGLTSSRQHKFDFLLGDTNSKGRAVKLPVDGFYEKLNLVIEYRERQHTESVNFFDKPNRVTVSGVHRGEQRKIYDERRRQVLPRHKIKLVEISYTDFHHDKQKRIIRNAKHDEALIRKILKAFDR